jgi:hypothetical protein
LTLRATCSPGRTGKARSPKFAFFRTQLFKPEDIENVKKVQAGYKVRTLPQFLGKPATAAPPACTSG